MRRKKHKPRHKRQGAPATKSKSSHSSSPSVGHSENRNRSQHRRSQQEAAPGAKKNRVPHGRGRSLKHRAPKTLMGKVQKNVRGFAFLIPLDRNLEDVYVSKWDAATLMSNDLVEFRLRKDGRRTSADILRIVERGRKEVLGRVEHSAKGLLLISTEGDTFFLEPGGLSGGLNAKRLKAGDWLIGKIEKYPNDQDFGEASIIEVIGAELTPAYDYRIAIAQFGLEQNFAKSAEKEAEEFDQETEREISRMESGDSERRDLRSLPFVTIDGETAKDFDDAIFVEKTGPTEKHGAGYILYVAIADVSHFVTLGSALDKSARSRATSVYFPGFCLPMLPEKLSNDLCSLRPQVNRLALTAEIHYDRQGRVHGAYFYASVIKTAGRLTYTEVHSYFSGEAKPTAAIGTPMKTALELYTKLRGDRKVRGVLDFDLPETEILTDAEGKPIATRRAARFESHQLIEEFMIAANRAVAKALREGGIPSLYRVHERPAPTTVDDLNMLMKNLGLNLKLTDTTPVAIAKILDQTKDLPQAKTLHQSILRLQKQARYEPDPKGHFGLALEDYTHFTSPIRRYPDLIVHRALKSLIGYSEDGTHDREPENMEELGMHTSSMERRAMEAERFVVKRKQCWFMLEKVGQTFAAVISGVIERGVFVEIPEFGTEGFVPIDSLVDQTGGSYVFDERRLCLRLRPGHTTLSLGDPITVQLVRVSVEDAQIEFTRYDK